MEPVRVKLYVDEFMRRLSFAEPFHGATGTVVWAKSAVWGGYQIDVELDEPHPVFGNFAKVFYSPGVIGEHEVPYRDSTAEVLSGDLPMLSDKIGDRWNKFRTKAGDPLPWSQVDKILTKEEEGI